MASEEDSEHETHLDQILPPNHFNLKQTGEKCIVGQLYSKKTANPFALMEVMKKAWKAKKGLESREWSNNLFLFKFEDEPELNWVSKISHGILKVLCSSFVDLKRKSNHQRSTSERHTCGSVYMMRLLAE